MTNASGKEMARLGGTNNAGINTVVWNMRAAGGRRARRRRERARVAARRGAAATRSINGRRSATYTVTLEVGGKTFAQTGQIAHTQGWSLASSPQIIR